MRFLLRLMRNNVDLSPHRKVEPSAPPLFWAEKSEIQRNITEIVIDIKNLVSIFENVLYT